MKIYNHSKYNFVHIIEIPKDEISKLDMDLCAQPKQTLKAYYDSCAIKPTILCNGGFFDMATGKTIFTYADDGVIISSSSGAQEGMGIINNQLVFGSLNSKQYTDFICGYPVLIENGQRSSINIAQEINYSARRTVLAYNSKNIYLLAVEKPGLNFYRLQNVLLDLKVDFAINLDGGGSTKVLYNGKTLTKDWGNRPVDNVVAFYLKPQQIYRVQLGAFSSHTNAKKFLEEIKRVPSSIGMDYSQAYIRKIGRYYKVQVGAFSNKANAVRVYNELKIRGYDSFITTT